MNFIISFITNIYIIFILSSVTPIITIIASCDNSSHSILLTLIFNALHTNNNKIRAYTHNNISMIVWHTFTINCIEKHWLILHNLLTKIIKQLFICTLRSACISYTVLMIKYHTTCALQK